MGTLLNRRRYMGGGGALPYDAEIEYLESTGTQFINTLYNPTYNTEVEVKGRYTYSTIDANNSMHYLFGSRDKGNNVRFFFIYNYYKNGGRNYYENGLNFGAVGTTYSYDYRNTDITVAISKDGGYINGTKRADFSSESSLNMNLPMYLLWCNISDGSETNRTPYGRIYHCKIWENGVALRDMIPVRVGTTGYMYDKVSGQLFGNAGTGSFTLGPDKT